MRAIRERIRGEAARRALHGRRAARDRGAPAATPVLDAHDVQSGAARGAARDRDARGTTRSTPRRSTAAAAAALGQVLEIVAPPAAADAEALLEPDADDRGALAPVRPQPLHVHLLHNLALELTRLNLEVAGPEEPHPAAPGPRSSCRRGARRRWRTLVPRRGRPARRARALSRGRRRAGPPAPGRALVRRRHRQRGARHPGAPAARRATSPTSSRRASTRAWRTWRGRSGEYRAGLVARDGLPLPLLDRQRGRPARSTTRPTGWSSIYHNITPAHFFLGFHPHLAGLCHHGRRELAAFAPRTELALGDSEFNRRELEAGGLRAHRRAADRARPRRSTSAPPSPVVRRLYDDGRTNVAVRRAASSPTRGSTT